MSTGTIKIAEKAGVFVVKMEGDVRLTLCLSFDEFVEDILQRPDYVSVIFDLTRAKGIDSTTLGLMAKFSIKAGGFGFERPLVVSNNPSITRILVSMGFEDIFRLVEQRTLEMDAIEEGDAMLVAQQNGDETAIQKKVLEAHRCLMAINDKNEGAFRELVETLESLR